MRKRVVVVEKCFAVGIGGIVSRDVRIGAARTGRSRVYAWSPGSAGAPITKASLHRLLRDGDRPTSSSR